jgi:hypothetical protein
MRVGWVDDKVEGEVSAGDGHVGAERRQGAVRSNREGGNAVVGLETVPLMLFEFAV